jgi:hypothetical protein
MNKYKHEAPHRSSQRRKLFVRIHGAEHRRKDRMCRDKRRFESENEAVQAQPTQRAYLCPLCSGYHLTTKALKHSPPKQDS